MKERTEIPTDTARLILARKEANNINPSIEIDNVGNIIPRNPRNGVKGEHTVMVRKASNSGDRPRNAKSLKACKGMKGCEFVKCAYDVFGKIPHNLEKACPTFNLDVENAESNRKDVEHKSH